MHNSPFIILVPNNFVGGLKNKTSSTYLLSAVSDAGEAGVENPKATALIGAHAENGGETVAIVLRARVPRPVGVGVELGRGGLVEVGVEGQRGQGGRGAALPLGQRHEDAAAVVGDAKRQRLGGLEGARLDGLLAHRLVREVEVDLLPREHLAQLGKRAWRQRRNHKHQQHTHFALREKTDNHY